MVALIAETGLEYVWTIINGVLFASLSNSTKTVSALHFLDTYINFIRLLVRFFTEVTGIFVCHYFLKDESVSK